MNSGPANILRLAAGLALLAALCGSSFGQDSNRSKVVNGIVAYYGVAPSQAVGTYPSPRPEAAMHGGVPSGRRSHHIVVALFDQENSKRITEAEVSATVTEVGLTGRTKRLEPMTINQTLTYGNYFELAPHTHYRITVSVRAAGKQETKFQFEYKYG